MGTNWTVDDSGNCSICGNVAEDTSLHIRQLHAAVNAHDALCEVAKAAKGLIAVQEEYSRVNSIDGKVYSDHPGNSYWSAKFMEKVDASRAALSRLPEGTI